MSEQISNNPKTLKVVSRTNPNALIQLEHLFASQPELHYHLITTESSGDKQQEILMQGNPENNIDTQEFDQLVLNGTADLAIHLAKDLPYPLCSGLEVIALLDIPDQTNSRTAGSCDNGQTVLSDHSSFDRHPLQGNFAMVARADRSDLKLLFESTDIRKSYGKVTMVGFGPGNADLLTLGGDKALAKSDIIFHDDLLDKNFLEKYQAEKYYVGKRKDFHSCRQTQINRLLLDAAKTGKNVVRLKGGDPMVFAHGGEEIEYLQRFFVEVNVIPGVSTGTAFAALTKVPLTHRGISSSVSFISGHSQTVQIPQTDTVVCFMGGSNVRLIAQKAITEGRNPKMPVMLVYNVSLPDQKEFFFTLEELSQSDQKFPTPVIIVIGDVVSLRNNSELAVMKPVILITGTYKGDYEKLATVVHQPLIQIEEILHNPEFENHINHLDRFDWVFFTSRYAVNFFFKALHKSGKDTRALSHLKIASVGKITSKALGQYGVTPDLQAADESSEGLIREVEIRSIASGNALIPRSNLGLPILPEGLTKLGWVANTQTIYNTTFPENLQKLDLTKVQSIVFSSPSCVTNFVRLYGELPADKQFIFRGKETEKRFWEVKNSEIKF